MWKLTDLFRSMKILKSSHYFGNIRESGNVNLFIVLDLVYLGDRSGRI